jgi:hypothetical protein
MVNQMEEKPAKEISTRGTFPNFSNKQPMKKRQPKLTDPSQQSVFRQTKALPNLKRVKTIKKTNLHFRNSRVMHAYKNQCVSLLQKQN